MPSNLILAIIFFLLKKDNNNNVVNIKQRSPVMVKVTFVSNLGFLLSAGRKARKSGVLTIWKANISVQGGKNPIAISYK